MKRWTAFLLAAVMLTGCSEMQTENPRNDAAKNILEMTEPSYSEPDLKINMNQYSSEAKLYRPEDIYLQSFDCGCVNDADFRLLAIETEEQLAYALVRYGSFGGLISEMAESYPISEYSYFVEYDEVSSGGWYIHCGALLVDKDKLLFVRTTDSYSPGETEMVPAVMGGFCHMAAVPKSYLLNDCYQGWTYPDVNNMYQDRNYLYQVHYQLTDNPRLADIYGDTHYIIRSEAEYDALLAMSQYETDSRYEKPVLQKDNRIDFTETALLVTFFTGDGKHYGSNSEGVTISGNTITMKYQQSDGNCSGMAFAKIPVRFLTEASYDEWETPVETDVPAPEIPEIDMSRYSENARIYTTDDIMLYSMHHKEQDFSGRYYLNGEEPELLIEIAWDDYGLGMDQGFVDLEERNFWWDNAFFVEYVHVEEGCDLRPLALVVDGDTAEFVYYDRNGNSAPADGTDCFGFYAAVPTEESLPDALTRWKIPAREAE